MSALAAVLVAVAWLLVPRRPRPGHRPRTRAVAVAGPGPVPGRGPADPSEPLTHHQVAGCADLLSVALAGGASLLAALDVVADVVEPVPAHQLRVVAAALRWGVPAPDAWRLVSPGWRTVASAFLVADLAGVPPSTLLSEAAGALRHTQAQRAAVRAGELSARIALPLGLTFLPGFVLTTIVPVVLGLARSLTG
ncbi:type II secretion system F family protein [Arsenicicoccus sp. oral taxon 190]|uniref:type II secretion system F family protein n=1 Tax=Arsenicicoccus sp. oral taxon 190 TaxID=1658671 RepID=UPI000679F020|nr:type II secretion system F family protein [Arsenicicoccus sp. oral taxon 190]AKT51144.1 hypothetical protein ADJ73_07125 [Arsenicicoccus sp. oral taxon 190]